MEEIDYFKCFRCGNMFSRVGETKDGRKIYKCEKCDGDKIIECAICHRPKTIWADDGDICVQCFFDWRENKITLSEEQLMGILKWAAFF